MKISIFALILSFASFSQAAEFRCDLTVNGQMSTKSVEFKEKDAVAGQSEIEGNVIMDFGLLNRGDYECVGAYDRYGKKLTLQTRVLDLQSSNKEIISEASTEAGVKDEMPTITTRSKGRSSDRVSCTCEVFYRF